MWETSLMCAFSLSLSLSTYKKQNSLPTPQEEVLLIFISCYSTCNKSRQ